MKINNILLVLTLLVFSLTACSGTVAETMDNNPVSQIETNTEDPNNVEEPFAENNVQITNTVVDVEYDEDDLDASYNDLEVTEIQLKNNTIHSEGSAVVVDGSLATITSGGAYVITGVLNDGQIIVDAQDEDTVRLILDEVDITSTTSAPIYIRNAEKTIITLVEGTENKVSDGPAYIFEDGDEPNAAIFSNDDLTINGEGSLLVSTNYNNGIDSDDDLIIISGTIAVTSVNDGIKGRDSLTVKDGVISINAGGDGMQANNDVDEGEGNIIIEGGKFDITADKDGIQAETMLFISGGDFDIVTGGGSENANLSDIAGWGDWDRQNTSTDTEVSAKGLKAESSLIVTGGTFEIDSLDDSVHSNGTIQIGGGSYVLATGDDGIHADSNLVINAGILDITSSYEGLESTEITINDGTIHVDSVDDGINGSSGTASMGGRPGMGDFGNGDSSLVVNGGYIYVDAGGDGVDVNGSIEMTDGTLIINGPTGNQNGAIDYLSTFNISGGFLVAAGSAGMAQAPSQSSTQYTLMVYFDTTQAANTILYIESQSGDEILTFAPTKNYQSFVVSSPDLTEGETYDIFTGGSHSGTVVDGLYSDGIYTPGTKLGSITISSILSLIGGSGGFMMDGGGFAPDQGPGGRDPGGDHRRVP